MTPPRRPLYFRLLGVRHLRVSPLVAFLLFEGSLAVGALLALADIVNIWGMVAIPVTVAIMVKLHDRVARALVQPLAVVQMSATRPLRERPSIGRSPVPGPARLTGEIAPDDAVASPHARPDPVAPTADGGQEPTAIGVAPVPSRGRAAVPQVAVRPTPGPRGPARSEGLTELEPGSNSGPVPPPYEVPTTRSDARSDLGPMRAEPMPFRAERLEGDWRNQGHFDAWSSDA